MSANTSSTKPMKLSAINMFPVKGLNPIRLSLVEVRNGEGIGDDRRLAIVNGIAPGGDPDKGVWVPCRTFFINAADDGLANISLLFDANTGYQMKCGQETLHIGHLETADLDHVNRELPGFVRDVLKAENGEAPRLARRQADHHGTGYWDYEDTPVSILNHATITAIAGKAGKPLDPDRFRGNLVMEGLEPFEEFGLVGERLQIGPAELEIIRPINRCDAASVNPKSGERDIAPASILTSEFGHPYCGVYARVVTPGTINEGDAITHTGASASPWNQGLNPSAPPYQQWPRFMSVADYTRFPDHTKLTLARTGNMPLPDASPGQKFRFHLPPVEGHDRNWTADFAAVCDQEKIGFIIEPSATSDPKTEYLRDGLETGQRILISGPYGRSA